MENLLQQFAPLLEDVMEKMYDEDGPRKGHGFEGDPSALAEKLMSSVMQSFPPPPAEENEEPHVGVIHLKVYGAGVLFIVILLSAILLQCFDIITHGIFLTGCYYITRRLSVLQAALLVGVVMGVEWVVIFL